MKRIYERWFCGDRWLVLIVAAAALLGLAYNATVLVGYGPDETRHMAYVQLLFEEKRFPFLLAGGAEYRGAHTLHPPLYYFVLLPFYALAHLLANNATWHIVRLGSLLICLSALPFIYQIAKCIKPQNKNLARLATAQVALLPMFGMTAGTLNNDSAAFLAVVVFLWLLCVKYPDERSARSACILGVCLGAGILCKFNVLLCDGIALVIYLLAQDGWRSIRTRPFWLRLMIVIGIGACVVLPWHLRNLAVYGAFVSTPPPMANLTGGTLSMVFHPDFAGYVATAAWGIFCTSWSQKDWIPELLRFPIYATLAFYCALAGCGYGRRVPKVKNEATETAENASNLDGINPGRARNIALWCGVGAFLINGWAVLHGALFLTWGWAEGGRYVFPSLVGFSLFLACGWERLAPSRLKPVALLWVAAMAMLNLLCIYWLVSYLNPTFGPKS